MIHYLRREQWIPAPLKNVWEYFANPENLNELTPPDMNFLIVAGGDRTMYEGQMIEYRVEFMRGIRSLWLTEISHVRQGEYFVDEQRMGPYRLWIHEHLFVPSRNGVLMNDLVTYAVPFDLLGDVVNAFWIHRRLMRIFDYRTRKIAQLFGEG